MLHHTYFICVFTCEAMYCELYVLRTALDYPKVEQSFLIDSWSVLLRPIEYFSPVDIRA